MTNALDRQHAVTLVNDARTAGARLFAACTELGIGTNTYRRWVRGSVDQRPMARRPTPSHALSQTERAEVLHECHLPAHASLPPAQIIPRLLDTEQRYLASESSFYRVLRAAGEQHRRGRARTPRRPGPPRRHEARSPNDVWSWDVSYLPSHVRGQFYYLYLIIDIYSRKIVGFEVFESENTDNSRQVIRQAVLREGVAQRPRVLHADNGSPMKGATLRATLEALGIAASHSRPRVSNDNAYSESLFRTCKYRPDYPPTGFEALTAARQWVLAFVGWYNDAHRHSAIRYVTPAERHAGQDTSILATRDRVYHAARQANPGRWSGSTRNWTPIGAVWLNPEPVLEAA